MRGFGSLSVWSSLGVLALASAVTLGTAACGDSESTGGSGGTASTGSDTGGSTTSGMGGMATSSSSGMMMRCEAPEPAHPGVTATLGVMTATILDQNGTPVADLLADVCGTTECLESKTDAMGMVTNNATGKELGDPLMLYGQGYGYARMGAPLPNVQGGPHAMGTINTIALPAEGSGAAMVAGTDVSNSGVTFSLPMDAVIEYDLAFPEGQRDFRAAVVDPAGLTYPAMDTAPVAIELLVATSPVDTQVCPGATVTFPNTLGWTMGAKVDVYYHGVEIFDHYAPYGQWVKISTATVTAEGIVTDTGEEIGTTGLFGLAQQ